MTKAIVARHAEPHDQQDWLRLWRGYCDALGGTVPDDVTIGTWRRIIAPREGIFCLLAFDQEPAPVGFANYVLHHHTWSLQTICYLEDLFVAPEARGSGVARILIEKLVELGQQQCWRRIYWHTHEDNYRARAVYDGLTRRTDYVRYDIELRSTESASKSVGGR